MKAILHGTFIVDKAGQADDLFFVWAERPAQVERRRGRTHGIARHPHAATALEIAELLAAHVPDEDWRHAVRLTRVAFLPSGTDSPLVPRWLAGDGQRDERSTLVPWRVEGLGLPLLDMLSLFVVLPMVNDRAAGMHRVGDDLRFWGIAAKLTLELLARERFLPGFKVDGEDLRAVWLPALAAGQGMAEDQARFEVLARSMPPACRALFRERASMAELDPNGAEAPSPRTALQSFVTQLLDQAVRDWGEMEPERQGHRPRGSGDDVVEACWQALWSKAA